MTSARSDFFHIIITIQYDHYHLIFIIIILCLSLSLCLQQEWEDDRCRFRLLPRQESVITLQGQGLQNRFFFFIIVLNIWVYREIDRDQGCTGQPFFYSGRGRAGLKLFTLQGQGLQNRFFFWSDPSPIIVYPCHSLTHSLLFSRLDWCQGCIICSILPSGMGARWVSSEHMENMEMFSCSPT